MMRDLTIAIVGMLAIFIGIGVFLWPRLTCEADVVFWQAQLRRISNELVAISTIAAVALLLIGAGA
jgi:hypothetical protein